MTNNMNDIRWQQRFSNYRKAVKQVEPSEAPVKYGLSEHSLATIHEIFARYPAIEQAVLYGSRAKGNYKNLQNDDLIEHIKRVGQVLYSK